MPSENNNHYPEERRLATVLFADIQGFTALAEQLDFETVSDLIKGIWQRLDQVIEAHNGYVDKHLGDGVMAVWGAPFAGDNDAEEAVAAGMDLVRALNTYCQATTIPGAETLQLRVGVNTGPVFAGYIGTRREYTVIGDTVNLAARLEQIAEPGRVVIGENTLRMVRGNFRVKKLEPTKIRGKTELVQPYAVEGRLSSPGRIRYQSADSLVTKMVGREDDLVKLKLTYERAFESTRPIMSLVSGDVGIGKSRLLMEFCSLLDAGGDNVTVLSTRGLAQASRVPFYLWRMLLRSRFGVREGEALQTATEKWNQGMQGLWENDPQESRQEATQVLGEMIGLANESTLLLSEERLARIFYLTREMLRRFSQRRRTVLLLDDLQWADRESLQLLAYILNNDQDPFSMMIIGTSRPDFLKNQPHWHNLSKVLMLGPLQLNAELVAEAYPDLREMPKPVLSEIALRAEGNPYFLEEIVKSLVKGGILDKNVSPEEIQNKLLAQIPESLRATLQARLDNLSREARTVALLASVVGRIFWVGAVMAAARSKPMTGATPMFNIPEMVIDRFVQDGLRQLVRAELAFPRTGTRFSEEQEYIFKNSYLRDVAYSLIPNRNRSQFHRAVAEWMSKMDDPAYHAMAREHEQIAIASAKLSTGSLPPIFGNER